jgi:outer membrane lipoprotein SlyB
MNALPSKFALAAAMTAGLALAGCATSPYGNNRNYDRGYQGQQSGYGYGDRNVRCQACGVVQEVQQVYIDGGGNDVAWRIVVRLDNGQYATVTQRENPGVRSGDYVEVRGDHVYAR